MQSRINTLNPSRLEAFIEAACFLSVSVCLERHALVEFSSMKHGHCSLPLTSISGMGCILGKCDGELKEISNNRDAREGKNVYNFNFTRLWLCVVNLCG